MSTSLLKDSSSQVLVENTSTMCGVLKHKRFCTYQTFCQLFFSIHFYATGIYYENEGLILVTGRQMLTDRKHSANQRKRDWTLGSSFKDKWCGMGRKQETHSSYPKHWPMVLPLVCTLCHRLPNLQTVSWIFKTLRRCISITLCKMLWNEGRSPGDTSHPSLWLAPHFFLHWREPYSGSRFIYDTSKMGSFWRDLWSFET